MTVLALLHPLALRDAQSRRQWVGRGEYVASTQGSIDKWVEPNEIGGGVSRLGAVGWFPEPTD